MSPPINETGYFKSQRRQKVMLELLSHDLLDFYHTHEDLYSDFDTLFPIVLPLEEGTEDDD